MIDPQLNLAPDDEHNRLLVENVHPPEWRNPTPEGRYNLVVLGAGSPFGPVHSARSPITKTSGWPSSARSGPTGTRPRRSVAMPGRTCRCSNAPRTGACRQAATAASS